MFTPTTTSLLIVLMVAFALFALIGGMGKRIAAGPPFKPRSLMNKSELRLFRLLQSELPDDWSVMCQVSYGGFLSNKSTARRNTISSKRADFVVLDADAQFAAAIEYQGGGHFGTSRASRKGTAERDRIKRQAMSEAGLPLLEIPAKFDRDLIRSLVRDLMASEEVGNRTSVNGFRMEPHS